MKHIKLVVIGGGPAGMGAAIAANKSGLNKEDILIIERDNKLGGILCQCLHNGFGLQKFGEMMTGPEYALRCLNQVEALNIPSSLNTMVLDVTPDKVITAVNPTEGVHKIKADAIVFAMGCRERPKGALNIPGTRPAGVYSAGSAQKFINEMGYMPGENIVILGSGDIGLITARRAALEGANVKAVIEIMPYSNGTPSNIEHCLNAFNIPLILSHTVVKIHGKERLTGVTIAKVDENRQPIQGTEEFIECDTLLLSVGLVPECELIKNAGISIDPSTGGALVNQNRETEVEGFFACGNVLHVHDIVDNVSEEGEIAGYAAAKYLIEKEEGNSDKAEAAQNDKIRVVAGNNVRYVVPQIILPAGTGVDLYFRVSERLNAVEITLSAESEVVFSKKKASVRPGEMERLLISADIIESVKGKTVTLAVNGEKI